MYRYGDAMFDTTSVDKDMYVLLEVSKFGTHHEDMSANRRYPTCARIHCHADVYMVLYPWYS